MSQTIDPPPPLAPASRQRRRLARRALLITVLLIVLLFPIINIVPPLFFHPPLSNTNLNHFDVIIVLGFPAEADGTPSGVIRDRVSTAVKLRNAGVADYLLMSGGAAHNAFRESDVMADLAIAQGVPADRVVRDGESVNSYQNLLYSVALMKKHGWSSALIVTSPAHVPRTARIAAEYAIAFHVVASDFASDVPWTIRVAIRQYERLQQTRLVLCGLPANAGLTAEQIQLAGALRRSR